MYMIYVTCLYIYPLSSGKPKSNSGPSHRWYIISLRVTVQISTWVQVKTSEYKEIHRDITIEHCHHTIFWSCSTSMLSKRIWPKSHRWKKNAACDFVFTNHISPKSHRLKSLDIFKNLWIHRIFKKNEITWNKP